jgi:hypothetical protein
LGFRYAPALLGRTKSGKGYASVSTVDFPFDGMNEEGVAMTLD